MGIFDDYPFIASYVKGEEAHLLTSEHFSRLLKVKDALEAVEVIRGTDVGNYLGGYPIKTFDELDERLWLYLDESLKFIKWLKPVPSQILKLINIYMVKYDVINIKSVLRNLAAGKKARLIPLGTIHDRNLLPDLAGVTGPEAAVAILEHCGLADFASLLADYRIDAEATERAAFEGGLDRKYYSNLMRATRKIPDGVVLNKVTGTLVDMKNLNIVFRAITRNLGESAATYTVGDGRLICGKDIIGLLNTKLSDTPARMPDPYRGLASEIVESYEKTRSATVIEGIVDRFEFSLLSEMLSRILMSPLIIVWYLILKEIEIKNLRLVFKAAFDGRSPEEVRDSVVMIS